MKKVIASALSVAMVAAIAAGCTTTPTDAQPCPGTPTVLDQDGNRYNTVQIGTQCWMKENLRCTTSPKGTSITCYDNTLISTTIPLETRGLLYPWESAVDTTGGHIVFSGHRRGICPEGWHVPSAAEWTALENHMRSDANYLCNGEPTYTAKALASKEYWPENTIECTVGCNQSENNASGLSLVLAGYASSSTSFTASSAWLWTSTSTAQNTATTKYLHSSSFTMGGMTSDQKYYGCSVRCVRDN